MNTDQLFQQLSQDKPSLVYLSGKTCTGKSTFARRLHDQLGYLPLELDDVVKNSVIKPNHLEDQETHVFPEVYRNNDNQQWIQAFVQATRQIIDQNLSSHQLLVIDGAVSNPKTLAAIFEAYKFTFVYFHPQTLGNYIRNLTERFMSSSTTFSAGLPRQFWSYIDKQDFAEFSTSRHLTESLKTAIEQYAATSQTESLKRQTVFQAHFDGITIVQI